MKYPGKRLPESYRENLLYQVFITRQMEYSISRMN
jgi:hypothetical protein